MSTSYFAAGTSGREKYKFYNSLAILIKAVEGQKTTVDLRNESSITGIVDQSDGFMNIVMKDCIFTDPRGDTFKYEMFFIHARNIRFVHIPPHIPIIPAIQDQLQKVSRHLTEVKSTKLTYQKKRIQNIQHEGLAAVEKSLEKRKSKTVDETTSESSKK